MNKHKLLFITLAIVTAISLMCVACSGNNDEQLKEKAQALANSTVTHEPTYEFDGIQNTLKLLDTLKLTNEDGWVFTYSYESSHAGYGDRTGLTLAQVVTPHTAIITIKNNRVNSAVMDGKWDMILQKTVN
jgi:hypothetical protein